MAIFSKIKSAMRRGYATFNKAMPPDPVQTYMESMEKAHSQKMLAVRQRMDEREAGRMREEKALRTELEAFKKRRRLWEMLHPGRVVPPTMLIQRMPIEERLGRIDEQRYLDKQELLEAEEGKPT